MADQPKLGDSRPKNRGNAGKGRQKGSKNKIPADLAGSILQAAKNAGDKIGPDGVVSYLELQAEQQPVAFMSLLGRVLPMQVIGDKDSPIVTEIVMRVIDPSPR